MSVEFIGEVKSVASKKVASGDRVISVTVITDNVEALKAALVPSGKAVTVTIEE